MLWSEQLGQWVQVGSRALWASWALRSGSGSKRLFVQKAGSGDSMLTREAVAKCRQHKKVVSSKVAAKNQASRLEKLGGLQVVQGLGKQGFLAAWCQVVFAVAFAVLALSESWLLLLLLQTLHR